MLKRARVRLQRHLSKDIAHCISDVADRDAATLKRLQNEQFTMDEQEEFFLYGMHS